MKNQHIDRILKQWPYRPGEVDARLVEGADGREVVQLRVDLGLLQMETTGRPDGTRPGGAETYFDFLVAAAISEGDEFELDEDQCREADREFVQFYQRRICWLSLREYRRAVKDADHNLNFMNFCAKHSPNDDWTASHEQYRPFILFHRTQAAALAEIDDGQAEKAIEELNHGLERMKAFYVEHDAVDRFEEDDLAERLQQLRDTVRNEFHIDRTLEERLTEAVAAEDYEVAAQLRDEIAKRRSNRKM